MDLPVTKQQVEAWQGGELIQNAMPDLSSEMREFIVSGITLGNGKSYMEKKKMDFHRVKSVKVVKDSEDRWTTLHIVREENVNLDDESVKHIAGMLSMREIDVMRVLNFTRGLGTLTEEVTLFPVTNKSIEWDIE